MKTVKQIGIWMDHHNAHIIEFASDVKETKTMNSEFGSGDKSESAHGSENEMHNREQQKQGTFYKNLSKVIKDYDEVLLFGPTDAKSELLNLLRENHQFDQIKIEVKTADKMSDKEQHAFVSDYFKRFDFKN